ncbi:hypothetical protein R0J87_21665, partial [Halomonas sp. SIMBA_159]
EAVLAEEEAVVVAVLVVEAVVVEAVVLNTTLSCPMILFFMHGQPLSRSAIPLNKITFSILF